MGIRGTDARNFRVRAILRFRWIRKRRVWGNFTWVGVKYLLVRVSQTRQATRSL